MGADDDRFYDGIQLALVCMALILCATAQSLCFKSIGYTLGPYPYFILIAVSSAFVPIFFGIVLYIDLFSGGFVEAQTSWKFKRHFGVIGVLNALNGIFIIFANPYVSGVLQTMLSQVTSPLIALKMYFTTFNINHIFIQLFYFVYHQASIPFTMGLSVIMIGSRFQILEYTGAVVIFIGLLVMIAPSIHNSRELGEGTDLKWAAVFLFGQIPAALGSVYQESAFKESKCNVVYMMAWSSLAQALVLLCAAPINLISGVDSSTEPFFQGIASAARCTTGLTPGCEEAGWLLSLCILTMLLTNALQAYVVKLGSAALSVLIVTLVTPMSAIAFTLPFIMGSHTETPSWTTWLALGLLLLGVALFRAPTFLEGVEEAGSVMQPSPELSPQGKQASPLIESLSRSRATSFNLEKPTPKFMASRLGIISSEYTGGAGAKGILFECTRDASDEPGSAAGARSLGRYEAQSAGLGGACGAPGPVPMAQSL